jgi:hypothetical protein
MAVFFPRLIGPIFIDVVISEEAHASMEIPDHPVEKGAKISDHAWRVPTGLTMEAISQDVIGTWRALNDLMAQAEPFDIISGFDIHESMMIKDLHARRDVTTGQILAVSVELKEVIIVETAEGGNSGTGGDERGAGRSDRGQVQSRAVDTSSGRGQSLSRELRAQ